MPTKLPAAGSRIGHYLVQRNQTFSELNLSAVLLIHEPTGARHLHLACDDPNNVFAVGFRTPPPDSTGVAHILEHTVLCGSQKYPVRDPFFAMLKRSLNTFMNAMTAADWTFYPVASMNPKDLDNLVSIYLDAVFFPLLRENDFRQEGHRLEFADPDDPQSPLQIKGVVYNEMKGAMADPSSLLGRRLNRALFPTNCYGQNSGGEPSVIPDLTWQQLQNFHRTFYHPCNSWFFTYGNQSLEHQLRRIETLALRHFDRQNIDSEIPLEKRLQAPVRAEETFPAGPEEDLSRKSIVQVAWMTCPIEDNFDRVALGILVKLLLGNPAAPLYQALIESGLGQNLSPGTGYHDDYRDTFIAAGLQGTDPEQTDTIENIIFNTLHKLAEDGFPTEHIEAALHQYEFSNREVTGDQYPYGLSLLMRLLGPWLHADDPLTPLGIDQTLKSLRKATEDPSFFPDLIRRYLLDNPHRVTLLLKPDRQHAAREEKAIVKRLEKTSRQLDDTRKQQLIEAARALKQSQEMPDDLSCLPTLELTDICSEEQIPHFRLTQINNASAYWFEQPTNGITYLSLQFDLAGLTNELIPHVPLFCALLPQIGAAGQDYLTVARRISAATGGIRLGTNLLEDPADQTIVRPVIDLKAKALDRNQDKLVDILQDILSAPDFDDIKRLRTVIGQVRTSMENSIPGAGHSFALRAAAAGLNRSTALRELWAGMSQVRHIKHYSTCSDQELIKLATHLKTIARNILTTTRTTMAICAEAAALPTMNEPSMRLLSKLSQGEAVTETSEHSFTRQTSHVCWDYNLPVAYVARVFPTVPYTHHDAPALQVLAKMLRANFLHREIREKGGAYGGMAGYSSDGGLLSMLSYRDPHLARTLDVYRQAVDWACEGDFSSDMIREAILASFGELDRPLSPGGRGYHEFILQEQGLLPAMRRQYRRDLLMTEKDDLVRVASTYLRDGWGESAVGIVTGEGMFKQAKSELDSLNIRLEKL